MIVEIESKCDWIQELDNSLYVDARFHKIICFYVINTPVTELSSRAIDLKKHGWNRPWNKKYYLNKQLKEQSTNPKLMYSAKTYANIDEALEKAALKDNFPFDCSYERIVVYNKKENQFISTFYHIRNSLAHGRFSIKVEEESNDWIFIFEDVVYNKKKRKYKLSARMILKLSTLLAWINLIENGEIEYSKTQ